MHSSTLINSSMSSTLIKATIGCTIAIIALGCGDPAPNDPSYKQGDLGNGGFLFGCADGVACRTFSGDAAKFPKNGVASGSTFGIRFVDKDHQGDISLLKFDTNDTTYQGTTVKGLAPFFSDAPSSYGGISAGPRLGTGTIIAETSDGTVIDLITLRVVKPAKLVVYDADSSDPLDIDKITLDTKTNKKVRIIGLSATNDTLAGSIQHAFAFPSGTDIAKVDSTNDGVSTFVGMKAGTTTVTLTGSALERTINVEVK